jgi:hypothetical protein
MRLGKPSVQRGRKRSEPHGRQRDATSPQRTCGENRRGGEKPRGRNAAVGGTTARRHISVCWEWTQVRSRRRGRETPREVTGWPPVRFAESTDSSSEGSDSDGLEPTVRENRGRRARSCLAQERGFTKVVRPSRRELEATPNPESLRHRKVSRGTHRSATPRAGGCLQTPRGMQRV